MERISPRRGLLNRSGSMPPRISTRHRTSTGSYASEEAIPRLRHEQWRRQEMVRGGVLLASIAFGFVGSSAAAQDRKGIRFWNLTLYTITSFQLSPAGEGRRGSDQCENARYVTVYHDERMRITDNEPDLYDVK